MGKGLCMWGQGVCVNSPQFYHEPQTALKKVLTGKNTIEL